MAKRKDLTNTELVSYRAVMTTIEDSLSRHDREARSYTDIPEVRRMHAEHRDAWTIARDALERIIRREQERRLTPHD